MKRQAYIKNPRTDRLIKVNGPVYQELKKSGVRVGNLKKVYRTVKTYPIGPDVKLGTKKFKRISQKKKSRVRPTQKYVTQPHLTKRLATYKTKKRSPSCGWAIVSPQKGKERNVLMKKCGEDCFLSPKTKGFPICPKCLKGRCNCKVDCRGLFAAMVRGKQWKYHNISKSAHKLGKSLKCSWAQ
jgi:hypothetical protein